MALHLVPNQYVVHADYASSTVCPIEGAIPLHPELENSGPTIFDLSKVNRILNLADGRGMLRNPEALRELFGRFKVFLYGSIRRASDGRLFVPFVCVDEPIGWQEIDRDWVMEDPDIAWVRVTPHIKKEGAKILVFRPR